VSDLSLDQDLLRILCCPACRRDLDYDWSVPELSCLRCRHTYPILDGIPVLFPVDVKSKLHELFGRYWDSAENAQMYDRFVEGTQSMMGRHIHVGELETTLEVLGSLRCERLLDCGCGQGRFFDQFPKSVFAVGIDASLNMLRICKVKRPNARLVCGQLENMPFRAGSFDRAISVRVLQHLPKQGRGVQEMARVLGPDGQIVIHCYNEWSTKACIKQIRMNSRWQPVFDAPFKWLGSETRPFAAWEMKLDTYSSVPEVRRWVRDAGLHVAETRGTGFGFNVWLIDAFGLATWVERRHPALLRRYLDLSLWLERILGRISPFKLLMEKFVIRGELRRSQIARLLATMSLTVTLPMPI
jgi:ubiquinone/menaquinone biosynthesis C-methylase UbiE/uncharacterized protein YbaR (Trm112 family)